MFEPQVPAPAPCEPGTSSILHPGTAPVLQEVPRAGQEHAAPCTQHLPTGSQPRTKRSQTKPLNPALSYLASPPCSGGPDLTPQQAPRLQPSALSSSTCFITSFLCQVALPPLMRVPLLYQSLSLPDSLGFESEREVKRQQRKRCFICKKKICGVLQCFCRRSPL